MFYKVYTRSSPKKKNGERKKKKIMCKFLLNLTQLAREAKRCSHWAYGRAGVQHVYQLAPRPWPKRAFQDTFKRDIKPRQRFGKKKKRKKSKHNWYFSLVLHFLALVNILLQNTKQDGAAQKCIMRTGTEISVKDDSEGGSDNRCTD